MVFFIRLIRSALIKSKCNEYFEMKNMAIEDLKWKRGFYSRFKGFWSRQCPILFGGKKNKSLSKCEKFQVKTITSGTYENFILKSIIGFVCGVLLTYIFFAFFVLQLKFSLITATYISSIIGCVLSLGLAFSSSVRCVVLMLLPQMFSKRGRQALVAYAFILVFTGPAKNTTRNMRILSETMACAQAKLKAAVKSLVDLIKRPFRAIKQTVKQLTEKIKIVVDKIKAMINSIKKTIQSIIGVIKSAYNWLNSVVGMCSKKIGTPFERCMKVFDGAIDDCKVKLGPLMNWMCSVAYVASSLCYAVKIFDYICDLVEFVSDGIIDQAKKKLQEFMFQVRNIFYIRIEFSHSFKFSTQQSKSFKEIASGIITEISQRTSAVFSFFDIMSFGFSFFFLWMVFQILNYRRKFMTNEAYDNRYITDKIIELDVRRIKLGRETILPLNVHERKKFAPISSIRLVKSEKKVIAKAAIFLALSSLKLSLQILTDYCLYWILTMIRYHGQFESYVDKPSTIDVKVDGKGMLSELYASVLNAFKPTNIQLDMDSTPCLPDPLPPDYSRYKQIALLMAMAWIICFAEPYGLRLRFVVMSYYHPERAQIRAVWLYNNIIRSRGSFLKYARRQLRRKFAKGEEGIEEISIMDRLRARFPLLRKIWKGKELKACLLCGSLGSKDEPLVKCPRANCVGLYCVDCYATLQNVCTLCKLPIEYGDISDISEERDSSEESLTTKHEKKLVSPVLSASEESGELNLTDALDDGDSELSYGYQERERDIHEEIEIPPIQKDVEAQKPRDRATVDDFFPRSSKQERHYSMTLAERTKSGIWALIPDSQASELRRRTFMTQLHNEYSNDAESFDITPPVIVTKMNEDIRKSEIVENNRQRRKSGFSFNHHEGSSEEDRQFSDISSGKSKFNSPSQLSADYEDEYFIEEFKKNNEEYETDEHSLSRGEYPRKEPHTDYEDQKLLKEYHRRRRNSQNFRDFPKESYEHFEMSNSINESMTKEGTERESDIRDVRFSSAHLPIHSNDPEEETNTSRKSGPGLLSFTKVVPPQRSNLLSQDFKGKILTSDVLFQRLSIQNKANLRDVKKGRRSSELTPPHRVPDKLHKLRSTALGKNYIQGSPRPSNALLPNIRNLIAADDLKSKELQTNTRSSSKNRKGAIESYIDKDGNAVSSFMAKLSPREPSDTRENISSLKKNIVSDSSLYRKSKIKNALEEDNYYTKPVRETSVPLCYQLTKSFQKMSLREERPSMSRISKKGTIDLGGRFRTMPRNEHSKEAHTSITQKYDSEIKSNVDDIRVIKGVKLPKGHYMVTSEHKPLMGHLQKSGIKRMNERDPEMLERWLAVGKYHCQSSEKEEHHKPNFTSKLLNFLKPLSIFSSKPRNLDGDNIMLLPPEKSGFMKKRHKKYSLREKSERDEEGRSNLWMKLLFWRKEEKIYNTSSSTSSSSGSVMHSRTYKAPTEDKEVKRVEKTSFKKFVHQQTPSQVVYDLFKTHKS